MAKYHLFFCSKLFIITYNVYYINITKVINDEKWLKMIFKIKNEKKYILSIRKKFQSSKKPGVSIIIPTNKIKYIKNIFKNYSRCTYDNKELIIILNNNELSISDYINQSEKYDNVRIYQLDEKTSLGYCINYGVEISKYNYIAKMDDDDYYGENYILDSINAFRYVDADIIGKASYFVYYEKYNTMGIMNDIYNNKYTPYIAGSTFIIKKKVFEKVKFQNLNLGEDSRFVSDCINANINVYSGNRYNYIYVKHRELTNHTWKIESKDLFKITKKINCSNNIDIVKV